MKRAYLCLLIGLSMLGCREAYLVTFQSDDSIPQISIVSEISSDQPVEISLARNMPITSQEAQIPLDQAEVWMEGSRIPNGSMKMTFHDKLKVFRFPLDGLRLNENKEYKITVITDDQDTIRASTTIPRPTGFSRLELTEIKEIPHNAVSSHYELKIKIELQEPLQRPAYYFLDFRRILTEFRVTASNDTMYTDLLDIRKLKVKEINNNNNAIVSFAQSDGVYIDESRLADRSIALTLITEEPLNDLREKFRKISVELKTMTPEIYWYNEYINRLLLSSRSGYRFPVKTYTNLDNALGVFGGSSKRTITVNLK